MTLRQFLHPAVRHSGVRTILFMDHFHSPQCDRTPRCLHTEITWFISVFQFMAPRMRKPMLT